MATGVTDQLIEFLRSRGVSEEQIRAAEAEGIHGLQLLASERILVGEPKYTTREVSELAHVPQELGDRLWRAMGFPDVGDETPVFTEGDARMLATAGRLIEQGISDASVSVQLTRVMGLSLARIADAQLAAVGDILEGPMRAAGASEEEIALGVLEASGNLLPSLEAFLVHIWRRHLAAATRRHVLGQLGPGDSGLQLAVGFVDMVGFTALSQQLDDRALGHIVDRFEELAYDTVAAIGGRVVKWIGDEVMFVADDAAQAAEIALRLAEAHTAAEDLPDVSVGLAAGQVLSREGDFLGPTVNLASRIVSEARPRTVVISESVHDQLKAARTEDFVWRPLRPRVLKGIGRVRLWKLVRALPGYDPEEDDDDRDDSRRRRNRD